MTRPLCALALVIGLCSFSLGAPAKDAKSNNKDKIVGKWKITDGPGMDAKQMEALGLSMIMEFKEDGTVVMAPQFSDHKMQKLVEGSGEKLSFSWKYKLGSGDAVEFYDFPKELKDKKDGPVGGNVKIKIEGDKMTIADDDTLKTTPLKLTKAKLTKMK